MQTLALLVRPRARVVPAPGPSVGPHLRAFLSWLVVLAPLAWGVSETLKDILPLVP